MMFRSHLNWINSYIYSRQLVERLEMDSASGNSTKLMHMFSFKTCNFLSCPTVFGKFSSCRQPSRSSSLKFVRSPTEWGSLFKPWQQRKLSFLKSFKPLILSSTSWSKWQLRIFKRCSFFNLNTNSGRLSILGVWMSSHSNDPENCSMKTGTAFSSPPPIMRDFSLESTFMKSIKLFSDKSIIGFLQKKKICCSSWQTRNWQWVNSMKGE